MIHNFVLDIDRSDLDDDLIDALSEIGSDDLGISTGAGATAISFNREAPSLAQAISSGIRDVESTGLTVVAVREQDLVNLTEVARRAGYSYEYLRLLARGGRGPGGFPAPVNPEVKHSWRLYRWIDVAPWLNEHLGIDLDAERARVIALANALLEARRLARLTEHADALTRVLAA